MKPIHIFLRHCYYSKLQELPTRNRPVWFNKEKVFQNFKNTIEPELADYTIVYDEHFGKIEDTFLKDEKSIEIINCGKETTSFLQTLDIVQSKKFHDNKIVYLLEDDYLHRSNWGNVLVEGFNIKQFNIDYITLSDFQFLYEFEEYNKLLYTKSTHWKSSYGSTNTFATKYKTLKEDLDIHQHYSLNPCVPELDGEQMIDHEFSIDFDKFVALLRDRERLLISPIPGYATHCQYGKQIADHLSPVIHWEDHLNIEKSKNILLYS
jgi:hypothetical protein